MCRERGAVRHDDRLDALAQGIKYFTDAMSISALEVVKERKREEWNDMLQAFIDDPQSETNHIVLGLNLDQKRQARGISKTRFPTWI